MEFMPLKLEVGLCMEFMLPKGGCGILETDRVGAEAGIGPEGIPGIIPEKLLCIPEIPDIPGIPGICIELDCWGITWKGCCCC